MVKRIKRAEKAVESLKKEIEEHFLKIENDIQEDNLDRGRYHIKEIDKSLLKALELKLKIAGLDDNSIAIYRERLKRIKKSFGFGDE